MNSLMFESKYHNKKIEYNGEKFDSQRELNRWLELLLLQKAGRIRNLERQVKYELIPAQRESFQNGNQGKIIEKSVSYVADFVYEENGKTIVEDSKGVRTDTYIIKRKLMLWKYGIKIKEV